MSLLRDRESFEKEEQAQLAPFAVKSAESRGRVVAEAEHPYRTGFQRDRDRILHSRAFRRLEYKTQVFVLHEGDHYRNRLTHTLEAAQVARTIARTLRGNEDLAEAVVLAHDLGHTPFGHAGERALNELLEDDGGFDHNRQSLRIVDLLEERYPGFRGLNLTSETREGILKHGCAWEHPVPLPPEHPQPCLEAQIADASDEIAYTNHDLDDGLRSGFITREMLAAVPLWREIEEDVQERTGGAGPRVMRAQSIIALINRCVTDFVEATAERLAACKAENADDIRNAEAPMAGLSPQLDQAVRVLRNFLTENLYYHPKVVQVSEEAARVIGDLYHRYREDPGLLPDHVVARFSEDGEARAIADYIAGMTDRFAYSEQAALEGSHGRH